MKGKRIKVFVSKLRHRSFAQEDEEEEQKSLSSTGGDDNGPSLAVSPSVRRQKVITEKQQGEEKEESSPPQINIIRTPLANFSGYSPAIYMSYKQLKEKTEENPNASAEEFTQNFRETAATAFGNAYMSDNPIQKSTTSNVLTTGLCEDVFSLVDVQLEVLHEYLEQKELVATQDGDAILVDCLLFICRQIYHKQQHFRRNLIKDLETTCAISNDCLKMMESTERVIQELSVKYPHLNWEEVEEELNPKTGALNRNFSDLVTLFEKDAVFAVEQLQLFVYRTINQSDIPQNLFSREWEEKFVHNQIALSLVKTIEDFLYDIDDYLCSDYLLGKTCTSLIQATVCFYVRCLVQKAEVVRHRRKPKPPKTGTAMTASTSQSNHNRNRLNDEMKLPFLNASRAGDRMMYDLEIMESYFFSLVEQVPALSRTVENEISILITIHECIEMAVGNANFESLERFIMVLHKRTGGNVIVTKNLVKDVWLLFAPANQQKDISDILGMMQVELQLISTQMRENPSPIHHQQQLDNSLTFSSNKGNEGVRLDDMLLEIYAQRQMEGNPICAPIMKVKDHILEGAAATRRRTMDRNKSALHHSRSNSPQKCRNQNNSTSPKSPMSPLSPTIDTKMVGKVLKTKISGTLKLQKLVPPGVGNIKPPALYIP
mmetsp:Transcript_12710/g.18040  ORF Transcript_12710/g.18040 Transcript_12710/m.18040 type:complete len:658 (-) Transcript_12710:146-2119(-)